MTLLQSTMQQPWCKEMMANLGFFSKPEGELSAATAGLPASSRPSGAKPNEVKNEKPDVPTKVENTKVEKAEKTPAKVEDVKAEDVKPEDVKSEAAPSEPPSTTGSVINSNTHRAAHARLCRKMQSMGEAECPNMQKLWNGTRKDGFFQKTKTIIFTFMFCIFLTKGYWCTNNQSVVNFSLGFTSRRSKNS